MPECQVAFWQAGDSNWWRPRLRWECMTCGVGANRSYSDDCDQCDRDIRQHMNDAGGE